MGRLNNKEMKVTLIKTQKFILALSEGQSIRLASQWFTCVTNEQIIRIGF